MIKIFMNGCLGKMGRVIYDMTKASDEFEIVAGGDIASAGEGISFPVFTNPDDCDVDFDVIIDFSTAAAVPKLIDFALARGKALVCCTTALSKETVAALEAASERIPVFKSANMSYGMNVVFELIRQATKVLHKEGFDIEVVEAHHNRKIDAPSGTAMTIADCITSQIDHEMELVYDRHDRHTRRSENEIGMSAIRGGNIVGEHEVYFVSDEEQVKICHSAFTRDVFARGSLTAARYVSDKGPGMYNMENVVSGLFNV